MNAALKQVVGLLIRHGLTAVAGILGWAWLGTGDLNDALVSVGVAVVALLWSWAQKKGYITA